MGASQSSSGGSGSAQGGNVKTSYYELLGVERHASDDEIKRAYRKKALVLHPDRNFGDEEHATKVFAEVQAAYEVLSDPQERAWYDSHETAILRGDDPEDYEGAVPTYDNVRITTADDLARMVGKFNKNVDFSDAPSGFFGYLRETFEQLAKEEEAAGQWDGVDVPDYPSFGHKDDSYEDVVKRFYSAWSNFSTAKSFAWKDKYRLSEAPDRWYRRRMEQENAKARQDGKREFNDAVRSLVQFIKKRDPRYVPTTQTEAERQKTLRDAAQAQAARARAANEAKMNDEVPEWTKSREPDPLAEMEGNFDEEEDQTEEVFECVACNKVFKSEKQWEAHEKSKKHQKAIAALRKKMRKDNVNLDLVSDGPSGTATPDDQEAQQLSASGEMVNEQEADTDHLSDEHDDDFEIVSERGGDVTDSFADLAEDQSQTKQDEQETTEEETESEDSDYADPEEIRDRLAGSSLKDDKDHESTLPSAANEEKAGSDIEPEAAKPKLGKAAQKRAKKAAAAAETVASAESDANHKCQGCDAAFATKTRLFQHLKDHPKHATLKPAVGGGSGKGKKKSKR
ncbi:DnaJ-domain-containing protein [Hortaea werneckii]|uniref:J domain-containing protein n=2 Tax=Hortaea werneckii TaxID=91943 RepID=A0A3M7IW08_HORWE|nr:DnaJ-domain-containing protein [Hortaea werneckii]OTA35136.1 hypothetical protein BTJ68_05065 [Hortaea werneckii EXF-2000]KAI6847707.1 DnaJ-domain-containing protein [Hortaea werneckii]KAI6938879.1 DnaJ-domain-containing protein [Hortaea werneckii]KAI6943390.1 DnaJ-domain-containing protein [Hortaea werneckii]